MNHIKILLADDHQIVIDGIKMILDSHNDFEVVAEVDNGQKVLDYLEKDLVDIAILDINMPVMDGITCARKIKTHHKKTKVIILTMYAQKSFIEEIIQIGIDGCLLKNNTGKELADAIRRVNEGRSYYDQIQSFNVEENEIRQHKLSERELDVIRCLSEGLSSAEIAEKLFISPHTVKTHRKNILKKLEINNSPELIQYAINHGLI
jgi:DNA-binding NarL/FixJ family response regulator